MTKQLSTKDLNCGNCIKQYHKECPMYDSINDNEAWRTSEVCGLACHPLALQVLAQPIIIELDLMLGGSGVGARFEGFTHGISKAIRLLKGGAQ